MPKLVGTAREYVLSVLREHQDREIAAVELHEMQPEPDHFSKENIFNLMPRLERDGLVCRTSEGRYAWWAITEAGLKNP